MRIKKYIYYIISISLTLVFFYSQLVEAKYTKKTSSKQDEILKIQTDFLQQLSQEPLSISRSDVFDQVKKIITDLSNENNSKPDEKKIKLILHILTKSIQVDSSLTLVQIASKGYVNNAKIFDPLLDEIENEIANKYKKDFSKMKKVLTEFYLSGNG